MSLSGTNIVKPRNDSSSSASSGAFFTGIPSMFGFQSPRAGNTASTTSLVSSPPIKQVEAIHLGGEDNSKPPSSAVHTTAEEEEASMDLLFVEKQDMAPLFGIGSKQDVSDLLIMRPVYSAAQFATACDQTITYDGTKSVSILNTRTKRVIATVDNDRFGSGRDLIALAYAMALREHIPWDYSADVNMAFRQAKINRDPVLLARVGSGEVPYDAVYHAAIGQTLAKKVGRISLLPYQYPDRPELQVEQFTTALVSLGTSTVYMDDVYDGLVPQIHDIVSPLGMMALFQPHFPFQATQLLKHYPYVTKQEEYRGTIDGLSDKTILGVGAAGVSDLAAGPEDQQAVNVVVNSLRRVFEDELDPASAADKLIEMGAITQAAPTFAAASTVRDVPSRISESVIRLPPALQDNAPQSSLCADLERGKAYLTERDFKALAVAIKAGFAMKDVALINAGYYTMESDLMRVFGTFLNKKREMPAMYRSVANSIFNSERDPVKQCLRLAALFSCDVVVDRSRSVPLPGAAAVLHMLRCWPQTACASAHESGLPVDYSWVFQ